ncbi:hypothetical protein ABE55_19730 [Bacillus thuringiensis]|uniref:hypothetical protein n=2 Tax=Bacillaceae TaxID=186817 RepID=UPI00137530EE|nr:MULTISPECIES: hypothetical protein [Bacillus cereus group]MBG9468732.1 hypothetical protein [Bacillus thuringiensis]
MTVETSIRHREITGTIFRNGRFQYEASHVVSFDDNYEAIFILGGKINELFTILCRCNTLYLEPKYKNAPRIIIELTSCYDEFNEYYFMDSFRDVNAFLKEMQPLINVAKHMEQQTKYPEQ